jgi:hypothetical protein
MSAAPPRASAAVNERRRKAVQRALAELPDLLVFNDGQLRHFVSMVGASNGSTPPVVIDRQVARASQEV